MPVPLKALQQVVLFEGFTDDELEGVLRIGERLELPASRLIFEEGEASDGAYALLSGKVRIARGKVTGLQYTKTLATLAPGAVFGEFSLLLSEPRSAAALTAEPSELLRIPPAAFAELLGKEDRVAFRILTNTARMLCRRLRDIDRGLAGLSGAARPGQAIALDEVARLRERFQAGLGV